MKRILESELMNGHEQARAYAEANLEECEQQFVEEFRKAFKNTPLGEAVLDLGCGPGGITRCFARTFCDCKIHALDGSKSMIQLALELTKKAQLTDNIQYFQGTLPEEKLPLEKYDIIISNSLLHHLPDPLVLWNTIKQYARKGTLVFVQDLVRPQTKHDAGNLVKIDAEHEPQVFRDDFYNSLLAAFELDEVEDQLRNVNLEGLTLRKIGNGYLAVVGKMLS